MDFHQKRMATNTWLSFEEKELQYRVRDNSGDIEFSVEYGGIPAKSRSVFERNNWLRNVGLIWCALGVINIGLALTGSQPLAGSAFWLMIGTGCLVFYRFTWAEFTVFDTNEGSIWVIRDKQHEDILAAISSRRETTLLAWYRSQDYSNDPMQEIPTVEWLIKQKALTKKDGEARIAEIKSNQTQLLTSSDDDTPHKMH